MSAATTENTAAPVTQPEVAQPTGSVEASDAFKDASDTKEVSPALPASADAEPKPVDATPALNGDTPQAPSQEQKLSKKETQIIATPITKGTLGYKAPGLVNQLRFKSSFCELGGDEPVHIPKSGEFFRGEKPDVANRTAAWSGHQGKGLLYIYKAEDTAKNAPGSILNLADATSVAKEGEKNFSFRLDRHKHTFEAKSQDERNGWLAAIESTRDSASKSKDDVLNSQGYKDNMEKLKTGKSTDEVLAATGAAGAVTAGGAAAAVASPTGDKKEEKAEKKEEKAESKAAEQRHKSDAVDEKRKSTKSRSRSNKRSSIFGSIMGKKEEKKEEKEEKKEDKAAAAAVKKEEKEASKEEKKAEKDEKKEEKDAASAIKKEEKQEEKAEKKAEKEAQKEIKREEKDEQKEQKAAEKEEKKEEKADKKDDSKVEGEAAAAVGTAGVGAAAVGEHKKSEAGKENTKADDGTEKAQSKRKSIFGIFDKAKSPRAEKKESEVMPAAAATGGVKGEAQKVEEKVVDAFKHDPVSAEDSNKKSPTTATSAAPAITPAATGAATKDAKSTEPKTNGVKAEEPTSPTGTSKRTSILNTMFRRPSKQAKSPSDETKKEEKKAANTPATVPETSEADKAAADKGEPTTKEVGDAPGADAAKGTEHRIGDVVPDAVNTGIATESKPVASTA